MGKYCYGKGRRRVIEEFTHWQGLWILAVLSAFAMCGTVVIQRAAGTVHLFCFHHLASNCPAPEKTGTKKAGTDGGTVYFPDKTGRLIAGNVQTDR
jgi:hypothetical protein